MGGSEILTVKQNSAHYPTVKEEIFKRSDIYGDQKVSWKKIKKAEDRKCELLVKEEKPLAVLIYKHDLQNDKESRLKNSLEVKTFLPIDRTDTKCLVKSLKHLTKVAEACHADNIHMTVSEKEKNTFDFLMKNNFYVCKEWDDKYIAGVKEYLVARRLKKEKEMKEEEKLEKEEEIKTELLKQREKKEEKEESKVDKEISLEQNEENYSRKEVERTHASKRKYEDSSTPFADNLKWDETSKKARGEYEEAHSRKRKYEDVPVQTIKSYFKRDESYRKDRREEYVREYREPKIKCCTLKTQYVRLIQNGDKTVEGRTNSQMFHNWRAGDLIKFHSTPNCFVIVKLLKVTKYPSFHEMLTAEGTEKCIPGVYSVNQAVEMYHKIPGYKEKEQRWGVLGFQLEKVKQ